MIEVNALTLFQTICKLFQIPFENLVSGLSDSTNYMCGKKNGFEIKPHNFWMLTVIAVTMFTIQ